MGRNIRKVFDYETLNRLETGHFDIDLLIRNNIINIRPGEILCVFSHIGARLFNLHNAAKMREFLRKNCSLDTDEAMNFFEEHEPIEITLTNIIGCRYPTVLAVFEPQDLKELKTYLSLCLDEPNTLDFMEFIRYNPQYGYHNVYNAVEIARDWFPNTQRGYFSDNIDFRYTSTTE